MKWHFTRFRRTSTQTTPGTAFQSDENSMLCHRDGAIDVGRNMFLNGITYGPFAPAASNRGYPAEGQVERDLAQIRSLGFNSIRVYESPTDALLRIANEQGLTVLAGIPWAQHLDVSVKRSMCRDVLAQIRDEAARLATAQAAIGIIVGNEIEGQLVRWMGAKNVATFLEELITTARSAAPTLLVGYASYPTTEYLLPVNASFVGINVFLEQRSTFEGYVQHLQTLGAERPLIITEFGLDSARHDERAQAEALKWQRDILLQAGVAGGYWFSYTDEWYRGGQSIKNWSFGIVRHDRQLKEAALLAPKLPREWSAPDGPASPIFSVIVCTRNGSSTLRACLQALSSQSYAKYEIIVIDDDSTDGSEGIVHQFGKIHYYKQKHAGLAAARNRGLRLAKGELLAYTDDDAMADEHWLARLIHAFEKSDIVAAGGPNLPPRPRNRTEQIVSLAPGGPAHVLLNDYEAEHLPGCNLAIRKSALEKIGGFHEVFRTAGDDVDICWRLRAAGGKLRFVPGAVVWHHRRNSVRGYLRQQKGYGLAEAQLIVRFPARFSWFGGASWDGVIYGARSSHEFEDINCGRHGMAQFQCIYAANQRSLRHYFQGLTTLVVVFGLVGLAWWSHHVFPFVIAATLLIAGAYSAWHEALQRLKSQIAPSIHDQVLLWALCWFQPIVRDAARWWGIAVHRAWPTGKNHLGWNLAPIRKLRHLRFYHKLSFWGEQGQDRSCLLAAMEHSAATHGVKWGEALAEAFWDADLRVTCLQLSMITVTEYHERGRTLTMLRLGLSYYPAAVCALALLAVLPVIGLRMGAPGEIAYGYGVAMLVAFAVWTSVLLRSIRRIYGLARAAARDCGLIEINTKKVADRSEASHVTSKAEHTD
jgi:O-antigen biosynthesis protein